MPRKTAAFGEKWTLKQVQGDDKFMMRTSQIMALEPDDTTPLVRDEFKAWLAMQDFLAQKDPR